MNYLLDKKTRKKNYLNVFFLVAFILILFYFRVGIFSRLSALGHFVFYPILVVGGKVGGGFGSVDAFFQSKSSLLNENKSLKLELDLNKGTMANYNSLLLENAALKEILDRKKSTANLVLSGILAKPNQSPYDTLLIDVGTEDGIIVGDTVFAAGNVPIGRIAETYANSSKVVLFSNSGEKMQVVFGTKDVFLELIGRGGGNFEMILPKDSTVGKGDQALLPGANAYVVGIVDSIISDPRDSFQKILLTTPLNIQELRLVEVEK